MIQHLAPNYFYSPVHPITVLLIGVGGTGSLVLSRLARLDFALRQMEHPGLHVIAYDDDKVERFNIGRQMFTPGDVGEYKSVTIMTKINRAFGLNWEAFPERFSAEMRLNYNIVITCVDNANFRVQIAKKISSNVEQNLEPYTKSYYWLDIGNSRDFGQCVLSTTKPIFQEVIKDIETTETLKNIVDIFPNLEEHDTKELQGNGCSYRDKLNEQALFINDLLSVYGIQLIEDLLIRKKVENQGCFTNLRNFNTNPIPITT